MYNSICLGSIAAIVFLSLAAYSQDNTFDNRIIAKDGILSIGNIEVTTGTVSAPQGTFWALTVSDGTDGIIIGDEAIGQMELFVQVVGNRYYSTIRSTTNIPIRIDGRGSQLRLLGGVDVQDGTSVFQGALNVHRSPVRIVWATGSTQGIQLHRTLTDPTGVNIWLASDTQKVHFKNTMPSPGGFVFDPTLSTANNDSLIVYAQDVTIAATDTTTLIQYINDTMYSLSWERLVDDASTQTIKEWVQSVSGFIMTNWDVMVDATGTILPIYIENRISDRLNNIGDFVISGTLTSSNIVTNNITSNNITANTGLFVTGTLELASGTVIIGFPTNVADPSIQAQIDFNFAVLVTHDAEITTLQEDVVALQGQTSSVSTQDLVTARITVTSTTNEITETIALEAGKSIISVWYSHVGGFQIDNWVAFSSTGNVFLNDSVHAVEDSMLFHNGDRGTIEVAVAAIVDPVTQAFVADDGGIVENLDSDMHPQLFMRKIK